MKIKVILLIVALSALFAACADEPFGEPSFLSVQSIAVAPMGTSPITTDSGYYTSDVVAAAVVAHRVGSMSQDTLGFYELPFTVPILIDDSVDRLVVYPAVRVSGISAMLTYYSFYNPIVLQDLRFRRGDTLALGSLTTTYSSFAEPLLFEPFEPISGSIYFDSTIIWERDASQARAGIGYGHIHCPADKATVNTIIDNDIIVDNAGRVVYLELDYRGTLPMQVYMHSQYISGGTTERLPVMVCNPTDSWQHIYITLGRTWAQFSHNLSFKLSFSAMNVDGVEGDVMIDNVKVIQTW